MIGRITQLTTEERTRRVTALTVAEAERAQHRAELFGMRAHNGALHQDEIPAVDHSGGNSARLSEVAELAGVPVDRWVPDHPRVRIIIEGAPRAGKSVIAHLIRHALAEVGIAATGPDDLRPIRWRGPRGALDNLIRREIAVAIEKRESGGE